MLLLANSDEIENKVADGNGRIAKLMTAKKSVPEILDELYLASLSRLPTAAERKSVEAYIAAEMDQKKAFEDVLWTLLNSKEFLFNH